MRITGTFLDEITHDIPSNNWGRDEWAEDFKTMNTIGIDTVILIRAGVGRIAAFEFSHFMSPNSCWPAAINLFKRYCEHFNISLRGDR
jgi:hypothetical protein